MVGGILRTSAFPTIGYAINASAGGKMSLPVAPSAYIYSHFRHVSGVPAPEGSRGVAISKLKILDVLIEQLARIKKNPDTGLTADAPSDEQLDVLIKHYESQIRAAQAANTAMPYNPAPPSSAGALLSLSA
ncbi:MAG: hypothetical protein LBI91_05940 [Spirochaetaceae bacterium]|jgi:hypothetical protein|nr:hypothetical protein [Spirochaetaceae bacterium]